MAGAPGACPVCRSGVTGGQGCARGGGSREVGDTGAVGRGVRMRQGFRSSEHARTRSGPGCPPLAPTSSLIHMLDRAYDLYKHCVANMDKAGDVETHEYWAGSADAYRAMILALTGVDMINEERNHNG